MHFSNQDKPYAQGRAETTVGGGVAIVHCGKEYLITSRPIHSY